MTIDYVPLDTLYLNNIFNELKYKEDKIFELIDHRFCTYILRNGKNKGLICGRKSRKPLIDNCCLQHYKYLNKPPKEKEKKTYYKKKEIKNKCIWLNKFNEPCKRNVKESNDFCTFHKINFKINNIYVFIIIIYLILIIITIIILLFFIRPKENKKNKIDINNIKKNKIEDILIYLDIDFKNEGNNQIRIKNQKHNIVIRNNCFYDNYNIIKGKGRGCIDFYMYIKNTTYIETIKILNKIILSFNFSSSPKNYLNIKYNNRPKENNKNKYIDFLNISKNNNLPIINNSNINYIINYLHLNRKISLKLINYLINKNYLSSDNNKNCVFYNNDMSYAFLRSTYSKFKKHTGIPDFISYKNDVNPLYLFESVIDMISYIDLHNGNIKGVLACTGGNMMINKIEKIINNDIKEIYYCFDNDNQGRENVKYIINKLKKYNIKHIELYPDLKDWNEVLKQAKIT
jgi:hypothetical protein